MTFSELPGVNEIQNIIEQHIEKTSDAKEALSGHVA